MSKETPLVNVEIIGDVDMLMKNNAVREFRAGEKLLEPEDIVDRLVAAGAGRRLTPRGKRLGQDDAGAAE